MKELSLWFVQALIGVSAEKVSLCLKEVGGQALTAVAVIVGQ